MSNSQLPAYTGCSENFSKSGLKFCPPPAPSTQLPLLSRISVGLTVGGFIDLENQRTLEPSGNLRPLHSSSHFTKGIATLTEVTWLAESPSERDQGQRDLPLVTHQIKDKGVCCLWALLSTSLHCLFFSMSSNLRSCPFVPLSVHPLIHPSTHPPVHSSTYSPIYPSTHLFICPPIHPSFYPLIHSASQSAWFQVCPDCKLLEIRGLPLLFPVPYCGKPRV